jgi:hypothetical protein
LTGNQQETVLELTPDAVRNFNETIRALHSFAQNPDTNCRRKESIKPSVDLKPRREVDRLRTADILQAMTMRNATDQAIPEEWMDELDDLVWRERDRLAADAGS